MIKYFIFLAHLFYTSLSGLVAAIQKVGPNKSTN